MKSGKNQPKFMITYLCHNCQMDFTRTELDEPQCFYCDSSDNFEVIKKERITPEVIVARLKLSTDRMVDNLKKAYFADKEEIDDLDEEEFIKIMDKANKLRKRVQALKLKEGEK